jgi:hypothetical protein
MRDMITIEILTDFWKVWIAVFLRREIQWWPYGMADFPLIPE